MALCMTESLSCIILVQQDAQNALPTAIKLYQEIFSRLNRHRFERRLVLLRAKELEKPREAWQGTSHGVNAIILLRCSKTL